MEYFIGAFKQYADFSGRTRRKEYWMFILIYVVIYISLTVIDVLLSTFWLNTIYSLICVIPSFSIAARRLHDTGRTGWWQLILFIPLVGLVVMLVFLCQDSQDDNEYGVSPKYVNN